MSGPDRTPYHIPDEDHPSTIDLCPSHLEIVEEDSKPRLNNDFIIALEAGGRWLGEDGEELPKIDIMLASLPGLLLHEVSS